jgi:hypothetical protein
MRRRTDVGRAESQDIGTVCTEIGNASAGARMSVERPKCSNWPADWPSPDVRLVALQRLASGGLHSEALDRAVTDHPTHTGVERRATARWPCRTADASLRDETDL